MSDVKTLFAHAGHVPPIARFPGAVLVLIDAQNEYVEGPLRLDGIEAAIAQARLLLDAARDAGARVIHVVHRGSPGGMFDLAGHRGAIVDALTPVTGEVVIEKPRPNSFSGTDLAALLGDAGQPILVAGYMTHMCVSSTVRAALDLGYPVTVASDACTTRALPGAAGPQVSAADLHAAELAALADRFAAVASVRTILDAQQVRA